MRNYKKVTHYEFSTGRKSCGAGEKPGAKVTDKKDLTTCKACKKRITLEKIREGLEEGRFRKTKEKDSEQALKSNKKKQEELGLVLPFPEEGGVELAKGDFVIYANALNSPDTSYVGDPFEVEEISGDYVLASPVKESCLSQPMTFNLISQQLYKVTKAFGEKAKELYAKD